MKNASTYIFALLSFLLLGFQLPSRATTVQPIDQAVQQYMAIKQALFAGNADQARKEAAVLDRSLQGIAASAQALSAAQAITAGRDLSAQRVSFARLTLALHELLVKDKPSAMLYIHYCPMAKAYWMDASSSIENPYLGKQMPGCGKTTGMIM